MDLLLALQFISQQHLNGVLDGEEYFIRLQETLDEAASQPNTDELMKQLAQHLVK